MKYRAVARDGVSTFSWTITNDEQREVALLIRVAPDQAETAQQDITQLVEMMRVAGLEPEMNEWRTRLSRNAPASVTIAWRGYVNDVPKTEQLLNQTAELWQTAPGNKEIT